MKSAQDYFKNAGGEFNAGFNSRLHGYTYQERFGYPCKPSSDEISGWRSAEEMIDEGKAFFVHNFHHTHSECKGHAFLYGGFWVCNICGGKDVDRPWWIIKVQRDGDAYCCIGEGFINLQESNNFAFGDTWNEAVNNYGDLMSKEGVLKP